MINGTIAFAPAFGTAGLSYVSAAGGKPQALTTKGQGTEEEGHRWPQLLPDSRAVLFTAWSRNIEDAQIVVQRLDTQERRVILRGGTDARYVSTGHLLLMIKEGNQEATATQISVVLNWTEELKRLVPTR